MVRNQGFIRRDDLAQVPRPIERRPITTRFNGQRVYTFPLPGAGRTLIEMLNVYQQLPPARRDPDGLSGSTISFKGGFITRSHAAEIPWVQVELSRGPFMTSSERRRAVLFALSVNGQSLGQSIAAYPNHLQVAFWVPCY
jgi:hypothetical protein